MQVNREAYIEQVGVILVIINNQGAPSTQKDVIDISLQRLPDTTFNRLNINVFFIFQQLGQVSTALLQTICGTIHNGCWLISTARRYRRRHQLYVRF